ncbi:hypothetical protein LTR86_000518 [Recurvomyces mirabilis]|nr:hypothetical protein LTR86_000518 [Recurvomyces mirabilis]
MHLLYYKDDGEVALKYVINAKDFRYAILSHRWGDDEILFADLNSQGWQSKAGYRKIEYCMEQAKRDGLQYSWVDTCCINKESSAEVSEAINSMYSWYGGSVICYAYLDDVVKSGDFANSLWFSRGWTLQELIAPPEIRFFDHQWSYLGSRHTRGIQLSDITNIPCQVLTSWGRRNLHRYSVAQHFSWAARRKTTRDEDEAYCLLGLMGVNMPLLYGEGSKAFLRLQEEIMRSSTDQSIFCWRPLAPSSQQSWQSMIGRDLLAPSPACFHGCDTEVGPKASRAYTITNTGLEIRLRTTSLPKLAGHLCLAELVSPDRYGTRALVLLRVDTVPNEAPLLAVDASWRVIGIPSERRDINFAEQRITIARRASNSQPLGPQELYVAPALSIARCWPPDFTFDELRGCWTHGVIQHDSIAFGCVLESKIPSQSISVAIAITASVDFVHKPMIHIDWQSDVDGIAGACEHAKSELLCRLVRNYPSDRSRARQSRVVVWHHSSFHDDQELVATVHFQARNTDQAKIHIRVYCFLGPKPAASRNRYLNRGFAISKIRELGPGFYPAREVGETVTEQLYQFYDWLWWRLASNRPPWRWYIVAGIALAILAVLLAYNMA